jgi:hypothetical protein
MTLALLACVGFSIGATACALVFVLIRLGRFPLNPWFGVSTDATRSSAEAWQRAHVAAAGWILGVAMAATASALLLGIALSWGRESSPGFVWETAGLIIGVGGVVACSFRAFIVANRAALLDE